jgi:hypothetical protein
VHRKDALLLVGDLDFSESNLPSTGGIFREWSPVRPSGHTGAFRWIQAKDLDVHVILDNCSTHQTPEIKRSPLRHPRFRLDFTPTLSSWLNVVGRWSGELTTKKITRAAHISVKVLEKSIVAEIKIWNKTTLWPTPGSRPPTRSSRRLPASASGRPQRHPTPGSGKRPY